MNQVKFLKTWSVAVGAMDAVTGMLLIVAPGWVLGCLGISVTSGEALVFLSWIGVFVAAVGLSYGWALGGGVRGETVWKFTALVRVMVAGFLGVKICGGSLPWMWGVVAVSDAVVGLGQWAMIRAGWWKGVKG